MRRHTRETVAWALVLVLAACTFATAQSAFPFKSVLLMHFSKDMAGGGEGRFTMEFTSRDLCRSVRRGIMQALKDANGEIDEGCLNDPAPTEPK